MAGDSRSDPGADSALTNSTVAGVLWTGGGRASVAILQIAVLAVLARLLTPTEFGIVGAAVVVTTFSGIFSQLGLGPAVIQRDNLDHSHVATAFVFSCLFGLLVGGGIWVLAPLAATFFDITDVGPVLRALAWLFPINSIGAVAEALARRKLQFPWLAKVEIFSFGLGYGTMGIAAALLGGGYWALVAAYLGQAALKSGALLVRYPPRPPLRPSWAAFRDLVAFGGVFTVGRVGTYVAGQGDNLVVGRWLGAQALGLYIQAYQLTSRPSQLLGDTLDMVLFPTLSKVQNDFGRLGAAYRKALAANALVVLPTTALLVVLGEHLVVVLFGPQWSGAAVPFQVLAIGIFLRTSERISGSIAKATGRVLSRAWRTWTYAVLVLSGAWVGHHWGIVGTAVGVTVALFINWLMMIELALKTSHVSWSAFRRAHGPGLRLAGVTAATAYLSSWALERAEVVPFLAMLVSGFVAVSMSLGLGRLFPRWLVGDEGAWLIARFRSVVAPNGRSGVDPADDPR